MNVAQMSIQGPNVVHHPPQITSASYQSTFCGRCAWALLDRDLLFQEIYELKLMVLNRSNINEFPIFLRIIPFQLAE